MGNNSIVHSDPLGDTVRPGNITDKQIIGMLGTGLKTNENTNPYSFKNGQLTEKKV